MAMAIFGTVAFLIKGLAKMKSSMMSSDVMQHELVERARESGTLNQSRHHQNLVYLLARREVSAPMNVCKALFSAPNDADHQKLYRKRGAG